MRDVGSAVVVLMRRTRSLNSAVQKLISCGCHILDLGANAYQTKFNEVTFSDKWGRSYEIGRTISRVHHLHSRTTSLLP